MEFHLTSYIKISLVFPSSREVKQVMEQERTSKLSMDSVRTGSFLITDVEEQYNIRKQGTVITLKV